MNSNKDDEATRALYGLFAMAFILTIFVFLPFVCLHYLDAEESRPKTVIAQIEYMKSLPLEGRKTVLIKWRESQEAYPTSGIHGFFKDKPSKGWLAYPRKVQIPSGIQNEKVWMKYVIKNRDLPIVEIIEIRILKE